MHWVGCNIIHEVEFVVDSNVCVPEKKSKGQEKDYEYITSIQQDDRTKVMVTN